MAEQEAPSFKVYLPANFRLIPRKNILLCILAHSSLRGGLTTYEQRNCSRLCAGNRSGISRGHRQAGGSVP